MKQLLQTGFILIITLSWIGLSVPLTTQSAWAKDKGKGGPPDHAPAHGYRKKFRYYEKERVFYDGSRYFWLDGGIVKVGVKLPDSISITSSPTTRYLETDQPRLRIDFN